MPRLACEPAVARWPHVTDTHFMRAALVQADLARERGEVPVGAVVVVDGQVVGEGFNQPITAHDPTAHAEVVALRDAARRIGNYRLAGATLYVTIEPCMMCVGAMVHARIARLAYGAREPKAGAVESTQRAHEHPALNHRMEAEGGILESDCREVIQKFFAGRRLQAASPGISPQRSEPASASESEPMAGGGDGVPPHSK